MSNLETVAKHFKDPAKLVADVYANGGYHAGSYGYITMGRFGGGIEIEQFHTMLWVQGYLACLSVYDQEGEDAVIKEIANEILSNDDYPLDEKAEAWIRKNWLSSAK